jgi:hypothetical protein
MGWLHMYRVVIAKVAFYNKPAAMSSHHTNHSNYYNPLPNSFAIAAEAEVSAPLQAPLMSNQELRAMTVRSGCSALEMREVLCKYGVCLVTGVLTTNECQQMELLWRDDLLAVIDQQNMSSQTEAVMEDVKLHGINRWPAKWCESLGKRGVVSQRGLAHGKFAWQSRLHPNVRHVFSTLFGVDSKDMTTGLDCPFWASLEVSSVSKPNLQWLHCDRNDHKYSRATEEKGSCVQGVLYIRGSTTENDSTTVVWPGSHREVYNKMIQDPAMKLAKSNSQQLNNLQDDVTRCELLQQARVKAKRVPCPPGSLLLWDSRTVHQGWRGGGRLAQPVCWEPTEGRDEAALCRKYWMCAAGIPSSHSGSEAACPWHGPRTSAPAPPSALTPTPTPATTPSNCMS